MYSFSTLFSHFSKKLQMQFGVDGACARWLLNNGAYVKPQDSDSFITSVDMLDLSPRTTRRDYKDVIHEHQANVATRTNTAAVSCENEAGSSEVFESELSEDMTDLIDPRSLIIEEVVANRATISAHGMHYFGESFRHPQATMSAAGS